MATEVDPAAQARRERIIAGMRGRSLDEAAADPQLRQDLRDEANSPDPDRLVTPDLVQLMEQARELRLKQPSLQLFFSTDDVILVPGFLGSQLADVAGRDGLIWIDPKLVFGAGKLMDLRLAPFDRTRPDADAAAGVAIQPQGEIPVIYAGLRFALEVQRYHTEAFGFDWRKDLDESAAALAQVIRDRANRPFRPLHLIAHSQGSLVARRALQLLGAELARQLVNNLVLLGPATAGTFSAALAIAGNNSLLDTLRKFHIIPPPGFNDVPQSMSGLYQLLPWRTDPVNVTAGAPGNGSGGDGRPNRGLPLDWVRQHQDFHEPAFWQTGVDPARLSKFFGWGKDIDARFFNDRTAIILGDQPTIGGVTFQGGVLVEDEAFRTWGDGTVPDAFALVDGVTRVYRARGGVHTTLPAMLSVIAAVHRILTGRKPGLAPGLGAAAAEGAADVPFLAEPPPPPPPPAARAAPAPARPPERQPPAPHKGEMGRTVPAPQYRRMRVFSFDPLLGTDLDTLGTDQLTIELPWDFADGDFLQPGPVGEYLEVVDRDPANDCFYPPVDLNHPHLLAQDGLPVSEGDPRFHQQMAYAVAMNTIRQFELALGRTALWGPHLVRDARGEAVPPDHPDDEYVRRLRVYPHGLRQANAFYDPDRKALLFGYFPAQGADVGRNLPGGTIFTCLSHDVIAHETTHALLDGVHRYFTEPSNQDVFAFHEAFADVVAMFQHFSHPDVLKDQIARAWGDLQRENLLGVLAAQFGEAVGHRGALRQYLGRRTEDGGWEPIKPDPAAIAKTHEPHARGAILVAALFRAFTNIYENRVRDLRRIATGGTGILPAGDLHPDLVARMANEAARAARHVLAMCIRALDYIPPVDLTFGEYLRALITADYDLVRDDDRRYRVSVVSAFRDWGIYPPGVRSLSVDSLLWSPAEPDVIRRLDAFFRAQPFDAWALGTDRRHAYLEMRRVGQELHDWLQAENNRAPGREWVLGLCLGPKEAPGGIRRDRKGRPVFEVHSCRPCRRIGPDGQQKTDVVVEIVQRRKAYFDPDRQQAVDASKQADWDKLPPQDFYFRGGCTLLIEPHSGEIRYCVRKAIYQEGDERLAAERAFRQGQFGDKAGGAYLSGDHDDVNPFAFLHGSR
jgi:hypothetical protein